MLPTFAVMRSRSDFRVSRVGVRVWPMLELLVVLLVTLVLGVALVYGIARVVVAS